MSYHDVPSRCSASAGCEMLRLSQKLAMPAESSILLPNRANSARVKQQVMGQGRLGLGAPRSFPPASQTSCAKMCKAHSRGSSWDVSGSPGQSWSSLMVMEAFPSGACGSVRTCGPHRDQTKVSVPTRCTPAHPGTLSQQPLVHLHMATEMLGPPRTGGASLACSACRSQAGR